MQTTYLFTKDGIRKDVSCDEWRAIPESECALLWVDVRDYHKEEIEKLAGEFGLHTIAVESCLDPYRRPHLYEFADHFYVNLTILQPDTETRSEIQPSELHLFAGSNFIITAVRDSGIGAVDGALRQYESLPSICGKGPGYAVYLLCESLVESYIPVVEALDDEADSLENTMLERPDRESLKTLFALKSRAFDLRKLLGPQRDAITELSRRDFPFIQGENRIYYQDIYNRMIRIFDMLDTIREILSGCLDIYLSQVSNRLNEVMKVLTVLATILGVMTFVTGFFGMNFTQLPWLDSPNAFRNIVLFMGGCAVAMLIAFRWKNWI
jgi:magnesium transporter